ncbi:unnamed protein product [Arabidopsis thaliana]|uniref:F-box domain-containing protein n=1 Tax=Arabidopsis thaliana TaxID=3702 RepID=A0A654EVR5_ARATH|nr:unnamed protein product [Arabidopsis thaliana]
MSEASNKQMKLIKRLPDELVEYVLSYLPVQSTLQNRVLSKRYRGTGKLSRDLDFSGIFSVRRSQSEAVRIIEDVFNQHQGPKIDRFVLSLDHTGLEDKILSWVDTCLRKNIKELVLDFSSSKKVMEIPLDFSSSKTLTVLKLQWCRFEILNNLPKGLRLLKTLSLMGTEVTNEMIDSIFNNCIHLESLELVKCQMSGNGILTIYAHDHKKFKSLVVSCMPNLLSIFLDAPTLECYKYDGYARTINVLKVNALEEAEFHYRRSKRRHSSDTVVDSMLACSAVHALTTTNILLEAITYRYLKGKLEKPLFKFENLREFKIFFKAPTFCTLFDIAEFLKECPKLEQFIIDIQNFTFEPQMYFWEIHHKAQIQNTSNNNYLLKCLTDVKIIGYKGHWHELDIVEFFVKNAPSLKRLELQMPKNAKNDAHTPDVARIKLIKTIFSGVKVTEV